MKTVNKLKDALGLMIFFVGRACKISGKYIILSLLAPIIKILNSYAYIIFPAMIISEISSYRNWRSVLLYLTLMLLIILVTGIAKSRLEIAVNLNNIALQTGFQTLINNKVMNIPYEALEDPSFQDMRSEVLASVNDRQLIARMISVTQSFITNIISLISYSVLIFALNPLLALSMILLTVLNNVFNKKTKDLNMKIEKMMIAFGRRVGYFESLTSDFKIGKDARIYNIKGMLEEEIDRFNNMTFKENRSAMRKTGLFNGLMSVNEQLQLLIIYIYISYLVIKRLIGIGDFAMYTGVATQFGRALYGMVDCVIEYRFIQYYIERFHELLTYSGSPSGTLKYLRPVPVKENIEIKFHNVSFKYPRAEKYTLKNINVSLSGKETLSIVGENGAGKTTFIKLLCGLYKPTEGFITINGADINEIDKDEYIKLLSVIFQDFKLFACSVKENIAFDAGADDNKVACALKKSGIYDKIMSLKAGADTAVYKLFDNNGVEFSGGEAQRLALARTIYKDAPIVILDEPTAALDPYTEYEIFSRFNDIAQNKLVVFISHRMSSCKLSDRILVFKDGGIIQAGAHDELICDAEGAYYGMYMAQARYYMS